MLARGRRPLRPRDRGRQSVPVVVKEQQLHPVRGSLQHIDLQEVKLDEAIQAEVAIELEGVEAAPGVKGGGVLEHVTREITVEALPTEIPDRIVVDVSAMEINDTLQLSAIQVPERRQVRRRRPRGGHDRHPLPTAGRGRARARGRGGDRAGRRGGRRGRRRGGWRRSPRATRATPRASSPCRCFAAAAIVARRAASRILIVGLGNPGERYVAHPPQHRLRGGAPSSRAAGTCRAPSRSSAACSPKGGPGRAARGWRSSCRRPS